MTNINSLPLIVFISKKAALDFASRSMDGSLMRNQNGHYLAYDPDNNNFIAIAFEDNEFFYEEFSTIQMAYIYLLNADTNPYVLRRIERVSSMKLEELKALNK